MTVAKNIAIAVYIVVCLIVIILATAQAKDSQGASGAITGSTTNNFYEKNKGRTREGKLKKWTLVLGIVFIVFTIALGIVYVM